MEISTADNILDCAVELAEQYSWEKITLHQIAKQLGISLNDIRQHYTVKDELVEAWYDRADQAMLQATVSEGFDQLSVHARLHLLIMTWLDFLARHKRVSRDMLLYKLEPAHIHLQIQSVLRISQTVQWLREAAGLDASHMQRITEELGLTGIYLNTFLYWMFDSSEKQTRTHKHLEKELQRAERLANTFFPKKQQR